MNAMIGPIIETSCVGVGNRVGEGVGVDEDKGGDVDAAIVLVVWRTLVLFSSGVEVACLVGVLVGPSSEGDKETSSVRFIVGTGVDIADSVST